MPYIGMTIPLKARDDTAKEVTPGNATKHSFTLAAKTVLL